MSSASQSGEVIGTSMQARLKSAFLLGALTMRISFLLILTVP